jgi:hypothetical protein
VEQKSSISLKKEEKNEVAKVIKAKENMKTE